MTIFFLHWTNVIAQQVQIVQSCSVSPLANYNIKYPKAGDANKLIDGIYTKRNNSYPFESNTTLGWRKTSIVTINLILKKDYFIKDINISTPSFINAGIGIPLVTSIFVGTDTSTYNHVLDFDYQEEKATNTLSFDDLKIGNINTTGRYIKMVVLLSSSYFLCDEINVSAVPVNKNTQRELNASTSINRIFTNQSINLYVDSLKTTQLYKIQLKSSLNIPKQDTYVSKKLINEILDLRNMISNISFIDSAKFDSLKKVIQKSFVTDKKGSIIIIEENAFADTIPEIKPVFKSEANLNISALAFIGGSAFKCLRIVNESMQSKFVQMKIADVPKFCNVFLYRPEFILARNLVISPDAWIPLSAMENSFLMGPGENQLIFIKLTGTHSGSSSLRIRFNDEKAKEFKDVNISYNIRKVDLKNLSLPYSVNWAYLNRPFYKGYATQAYNDLLNHHINVLVVPANMMYVRGGVYSATKTFNYIKEYTGFKRYLCFFAIAGYIPKIFDDKTQIISDEYLKMFQNWYDSLLSYAKNVGILPEQILLYPLDELKGKIQVDFFQVFQKWFHSKYKQEVIYATINSKQTLETLSTDKNNIYQIYYDTAFVNILKSNNDIVKWIYETRGPAKGKSPDKYYRLMSWRAFQLDFTGVGFWNYADLDHSAVNSEWNDFDGMGADFNMVYRYHNTLITSRRWEAFSLGLEDYALLKAYEKKYSRMKALELCNYTIYNSIVSGITDNVRTNILNAL